ncbi:MAG: hypothetical protein AAFR60_05920 [Pseudomonadota bacterium]
MFQRLTNAPLPVTLLILSFLCPIELSADAGGFRLPPHRAVILLLFVPALWTLIARASTRFRTFDALIFAHAICLFYVYTLHGEEDEGLIYGGSVAMETLGAYIVARAFIRDWYAFRATLELLVLACVIAFCFAVPETLLGRHFTHDFLQSITGFDHPREIETRLGFVRAYGTFDHPIHLGTFSATIFALLWFSGKRQSQRMKACGVSVATTLCSLSSAPILCIMTQVGLIGWDQVTRGLKGRIGLTCLAILFVYLMIELFATRSLMMIIATGFTIDSWTGFYRTQIWYWGMRTVWEYPWVGIGLADWERAWWMHSDSVDAFWLVTAMRTGIPSVMLLILGMLTMVFAVGFRAGKMKDPRYTNPAKAWLISLIAISLAACTVHFWNVSVSYFFFLLGFGGWLADPMPERFRNRLDAKMAARRARRRAMWGPKTAPATSNDIGPGLPNPA